MLAESNKSILNQTVKPSILAKQKMKSTSLTMMYLLFSCYAAWSFHIFLFLFALLIMIITSLYLMKLYGHSLKLDENDELLEQVCQLIASHSMVSSLVGKNDYCEGIIVVDDINDKILLNGDYINTNALIEAKLQYKEIVFITKNNDNFQYVKFNSENEALTFFIALKNYLIDFMNNNPNLNFKPKVKDERMVPAISLFDKHNIFVFIPLFFPIFNELMYYFEVTPYLNVISSLSASESIIFVFLCSIIYLICLILDERLLVSKNIINSIDGKIWVLILPAIAFYFRSKKLRQLPLYSILSISTTVYVIITMI